MKIMGVIVVDVQGDFTTWKKGALAVEGTDAAFIEKLRKATGALKQSGYTVLATQDWHPADHISFYTNHPGRKPFDVVAVRDKKQVLWPPHCVQGTENAKLLLDETFFDAVVQKGKDRNYDSYSGFQDDGGARTEMDGLLKKRSIQDLIVYGIATDYCVKATALDAAKAGYKATVVAGLSRGVAPDTTAEALEEMKASGIAIREEL
ncbi:MAG: isochorismatase family protein [Deltaproteobacteria bacterium]|nr:isochorismatase family protein [Deltaproteobacteria bacterium]